MKDFKVCFNNFPYSLRQISCNDGLPQKICTDCFSKFCTVSSFRVQCLEAQTILSNIFDKIDTQSIQDDEVFEGFINEQDNDINTKTTTTSSFNAAQTPATQTEVLLKLKPIEHALGTQEEEKSSSSNNNSNSNNGEYECLEQQKKTIT